jgi:hypothetical protein
LRRSNASRSDHIERRNQSVNDQTLRWAFTVNQEISVTALGLFDDGLNGLTESHAVGIWADGSLIAQTTVPSGLGVELVENFRYTSIAPITLVPGETYVIGGVYDAFSPDFVPATAATIAADVAVNYEGAKFGLGIGLIEPNAEASPGGYFGPNFLFSERQVPEGSAGFVLFGAVVICLCGINRLTTHTTKFRVLCAR